MTIAVSNAAFQSLQDTSLDDLYFMLATAEAGTDKDVGLALHGMRHLKRATFLPDLWVAKGKALFAAWWPQVKELVCRIYAENGDDDSALNGWVAAAAAAVAAALNITGAAAVTVITIVIKLGLDSMCEAA